ncbi:MAG: hypothetical protein JNG89_21115 [Planctomycetaceae bacterium]|nr:hypothetical protein [Planctomycetaceae bacterium]
MRLLMLAVCGMLLFASAGCSLNEGFAWTKERNYSDPTKGSDDPWVSNVGDEVSNRGARRSEKSGEPQWFRELTMSDRAREIESNLGISE